MSLTALDRRIPPLGRLFRRSGAVSDPAALFAADGMLGRYPGPALVMGAGDGVRHANNAFARLPADASAALSAALAAPVRHAVEIDATEVRSVALPAADGQSVFEFTILPRGDGRTALVLGHDETLAERMRGALIESRQRFKGLVEISSDFVWETGPDGSFAYVSPRGALGYTARELIARRPADFAIEQPGPPVPSPFLTRRPLDNAEVWFRRSGGGAACLDVSAIPIFDGQGEWVGTRGVCRDVTDLREHEAALARAHSRERLFSYIMRAINENTDATKMLATTARSVALGLDAAECRICRMRPEAGLVEAAAFGSREDADRMADVLAGIAVGATTPELVQRGTLLAVATRHGGRLNGAIALRRPAEAPAWAESDGQLLIQIGRQLGVVLTQLADREELRRLSRTDPLTGLLNRRVFYEELELRLARAGRTGRSGALCYLDLDNFKAVNDLQGHQRGDEVLRLLTTLLKAHGRANDLLARLGGDEFALWLDETGRRGADKKAGRLLESSRKLRDCSATDDKPLGLSIGVAVHDPVDGEGLEGLMARADGAMYEVKRNGKGGYRLAPPAMETER